jgi:hypothetical protein
MDQKINYYCHQNRHLLGKIPVIIKIIIAVMGDFTLFGAIANIIIIVVIQVIVNGII